MDKNEILRKLPQIDELCGELVRDKDISSLPHDFVVNCVRDTISETRTLVLNNSLKDILKDDLIEDIKTRIKLKLNYGLKRVINATGTILHTNLGRSILSKEAMLAVENVACSYSNLEYDLKHGDRGDRHSHIEKLIVDLTGCEAAMVVNNNAAATMLVLATLAKGREAIISRGELIEIGGAFRIPDVMAESGAILREVGTTNKTKLSDYKNAINEETAVLMKVHKSNYKILGFTEETDISKLVDLGKECNLPVIYDMGNGLFVDLNEYGIDEPTVPSLVKVGADVVLFSGDKLLGGPQAGIIIGKSKYINMMKKHPLARSMRVDKFTIAALYATLFEYYDNKSAKSRIPVLNMITMSRTELKDRAEKLADILRKKVGKDFIIDIEEVKDQVGAGTAPHVFLDGYAVSLTSDRLSAEKIEKMFRSFDVPIIVRVARDKVMIDVRTILDTDEDLMVNEISNICKM